VPPRAHDGTIGRGWQQTDRATGAYGVVYASSGNKIPVLYAVHAATGRGLWRRSLGVSEFPAYLAVADGVVFAGLTRINGAPGLNAGDLSALDAATGQRL
jgi:outer membrane protein assembly factor BamB